MKKSLSLLVLMSLVFIGFISASICEDNDGGIYYQSRGTATFIHPDTGSESVETDYCMMDNKTLYERYCEEDYKIGLDI